MDGAPIFVLTSLYLDDAGNVAYRNVRVTFDRLEAEAHRARDIEYDFQSSNVSVNWREDAEQSNLVAMSAISAGRRDSKTKSRRNQFSFHRAFRVQ
jgi:hypothetical protein